jgi:hypothetical protein
MDSYDYEISIGPVASFDFHTLPSHLRNQKSLYRPFFRRHDMHLELTRAPRGSDLEADEACPMTTTRRSAWALRPARSLENGIAAEPPMKPARSSSTVRHCVGSSN